MKKLILVLTIGCTSILNVHAQLSEKAEISVITCGPWQEELYSAFGHSAFRVHDPEIGIDEAYNYGVFDFDQPNFYLNFARGYLYYKLGVYDYQAFKNYYIAHNRYVHEQVLNLTPTQKQRLYDSLQINALPENQHYRYDYFYDNCAVRLPNMMVKTFGDSVKFDGSYIIKPLSFRDLTDLYLMHQPWGDLGIDICLGLPMDKVATPYEHMFLPDYVESGFDHASIQHGLVRVPLVKEKIIVYESRDEDLPDRLPHPLYVFGILAVLVVLLSAWDVKRKKLSTWFDFVLFVVVGLIGMLLLFLWVATDHEAAANNLNILWALPTHVIAAIALFRNPQWLRSYFLITLVLTVLLLIGWFILPQELHYALIPVVVIIGVRAFTQYWLRKKMIK